MGSQIYRSISNRDPWWDSRTGLSAPSLWPGTVAFWMAVADVEDDLGSDIQKAEESYQKSHTKQNAACEQLDKEGLIGGLLGKALYIDQSAEDGFMHLDMGYFLDTHTIAWSTP